MPHTSRKKKNRIQKRMQVAGEDGWTHITTSRTTAPKRTLDTNVHPTSPTMATATGATTVISHKSITGGRTIRKGPPIAVGATAQADMNMNYNKDPSLSQLCLAEAPTRLTIDELKKQFEAHRQQWKTSSTWKTLKRTLMFPDRNHPKFVGCSSDSGSSHLDRVNNVICFGLGSPSGFGRGGWVDRRSISLYQLAALESMIEILGLGEEGEVTAPQYARYSTERETPANQLMNHTTTTGTSNNSDDNKITVENKRIYAQDPIFNELDKQLLHSLRISVVKHPAAFNLINDHSFLFCPGAEYAHLTRLLVANPAIVFANSLENIFTSASSFSLLPSSLSSSSSLPRQSSEKNDNTDVNDNGNGNTQQPGIFLHERRSWRLPEFGPNPHAFWNVHLYWKSRPTYTPIEDG